MLDFLGTKLLVPVDRVGEPPVKQVVPGELRADLSKAVRYLSDLSLTRALVTVSVAGVVLIGQSKNTRRRQMANSICTLPTRVTRTGGSDSFLR